MKLAGRWRTVLGDAGAQVSLDFNLGADLKFHLDWHGQGGTYAGAADGSADGTWEATAMGKAVLITFSKWSVPNQEATPILFFIEFPGPDTMKWVTRADDKTAVTWVLQRMAGG